jgi:DNA polymerase-1
MTTPTLLIDGDTIVYKFACGLEKTFDWGEGVISSHADGDAGKRFVDHFLAEVADAFGGASIRIALSDPEVNWRLGILETYKQNRSDFVRPIIWAELREYLRYAYDVYQRPTLEGDDICGILATHPRIIPGPKVIVGIDKDLRTIPGRHYNPNTKEHFVVTEAQADWSHLYQALVGDVIDNYKGCPFIGPVKAKKILGPVAEFSVADAWPRVLEAFEAKGQGLQHALQQAQVARICRHVDFDFHSKKVIPWRPPS